MKRRAGCWRAALVFIIPLCLLGGWYGWRPLPIEKNEQIYQGVSYFRSVRLRPRPVIVHGLIIDLKAPGLSFLVTPGSPGKGLPYKARTTSQFLAEFDVQVAINGDGFTPWWSHVPWDYFPHAGERVETMGLAVSKGKEVDGGFRKGREREPTLYISKGNAASFRPPSSPYNAISGNVMLVQNGAPVKDLASDRPQPRTAVALDRSGDKLLIFVVDGRQVFYSQGLTLLELARIIVDYGGYQAMNLDGGGSTTLVKEGWLGRPDVLNAPIDLYLPLRQRPVANHLGIFAQPVSR